MQRQEGGFGMNFSNRAQMNPPGSESDESRNLLLVCMYFLYITIILSHCQRPISSMAEYQTSDLGVAGSIPVWVSFFQFHFLLL